jgi:hypothetical protein
MDECFISRCGVTGLPTFILKGILIARPPFPHNCPVDLKTMNFTLSTSGELSQKNTMIPRLLSLETYRTDVKPSARKKNTKYRNI